MKLRYLSLLVCSLALASCESTPEREGDGDGDPKTEYVEYKVDFSSYDLGTSGVLQSGDATFNSKIMGLVNTEETILANIEVENPTANTVKIQKKDFAENYGSAQGLIIGGSSQGGELTLNFIKKLSYVTIKAQQYYNPQYDYSAGNPPFLNPNYDGQEYHEIDDGQDYYFLGYFKLSVNATEWIGPGEGIEYDEDWNMLIKTPEIAERKFEIDHNSLTIEGFESERARIYEMIFGFEKE